MAGARVTITVDDNDVMQGLRKLQERIGNLKPVFIEIGKHLERTTDARFDSMTAPDGSKWEALKPSTKAQKKFPGKILQESGILRDSLHYVADANSLEFGTDRAYGAIHQFGAKKGDFGQNKRGNPIPWGDIPARPYLGLSNEDFEEINQIIADHLGGD